MNSEVEFTYEIAENFLDEVLKKKEQKYLSDAEKMVFKGSWEGLPYKAMVKGYNYTEDYLRQIGQNLWDKLSELLEEKVSKTNFKEALKRKWKQNLSERQHDSEVHRQIPKNATYIERQPIESICNKTILQPGSLIRIKAPKKMGKTWLANRILEQAKRCNYQTVSIDLLEVNTADFQDSDKFLWWFCTVVGYELNIPQENLHEFWDENYNSKINCKIYFEKCLLPKVTEALVLCIDNIDLIFKYPTTAQDFLGLLRSWHEKAKRKNLWKKLRLVVVYSTEVYIPLDINTSPFNVGELIELPEFNLEQVHQLTEIYELNWQDEKVKQLTNVVGWHPFLLDRALYYLKNYQNSTLSELLEKAPTNEGIYRIHLQDLLSTLEANPQLKAAFKKVVMTKEPVKIESLLANKLYGLGLVKLVDNDVVPRCELYRKYFNECL